LTAQPWTPHDDPNVQTRRYNAFTGGIFGAIAQLGERYNGIVEVVGSIPTGSTSFNKGLAFMTLGPFAF
tara:strand:- start:109 stop:315 length:207 start_codon:yes stop_codon:yes gene_type:complete